MRILKKAFIFFFIFFATFFFAKFSYANNFTIKNLGNPGFNQTNIDYTTSPVVVLDFAYLSSPNICRYINYNFATAPGEGNILWSIWEPCVTQKYWSLGALQGNKTVYCQVNLTNKATFLLNDSIVYNITGAGLDITPPSMPVVYIASYSNDNNSIYVYWEKSNDIESEIFLGIPIIYEVKIFKVGTPSDIYINSTYLTSINARITKSYINHNNQIFAEVTAINSAGLRTKGTSGMMMIDLQQPAKPNITKAEFLNISVQPMIYKNFSIQQWLNTKSLRYYWNSSDTLSGIAAYSYILAKETGNVPDTIPEVSENGIFSSEQNKTFEGIKTGIYSFSVRAMDSAGNWGQAANFTAKIDNTPPTKPVVTGEFYNQSENKTTYYWSYAQDIDSGIMNYSINLTSESGTSLPLIYLPITNKYNLTGPAGKFKIVVGAINYAGIWKWSNEKDTLFDREPPKIITKSPTALHSSKIAQVILITDENAFCYYNNSLGNFLGFDASGNTRHETAYPLVKDGTVTIALRCSDFFNNTVEDKINFNAVLNASVNVINPTSPAIMAYSSSKANFTVEIYSGPEHGNVLLAGKKKKRI
ncbi:MAG: hypothetical protein V1859_03925 [archaeon]